MVAILSSSGQQRGQMRYAAYGVPFGLPPGDLDADGDCDFTDLNTIAGWVSTSTYDVRADLDLDGDVDATDQSILSSLSYGTTLGRGKLAPGPTSSAAGAGVRRGYAGYEHDGVIFTIAHVRHRVLLTELGRWTRRDPLGYVDGMSLYGYGRALPTKYVDSDGRRVEFPCGNIESGRPGEHIYTPGLPGYNCNGNELQGGLAGIGEPGEPPGGGGQRPITDEEACQIMCSSRPSGVLGIASCNNGRPISCVCENNLRPLIRRLYPNSNFGVLHGIISDCVRVHETDHTQRGDCSNTPGIGPSLLDPQWSPPYWLPGLTPARADECLAKIMERDCLATSFVRCNDIQCIIDLMDWLIELDRLIAMDGCYTSGRPWPPDLITLDFGGSRVRCSK